jgi:hypothetical protein
VVLIVDILPKKKKVVITVKPHTINVGPKKPNNGGQGTETPIAPVNLRKPLWKKCIEIVKEDLRIKKIETDAIMRDDPSWEEYLKFRELAMKGKKE